MDLHRRLISFASDLVGLSGLLVLLLIVFVPLERIFGNRSQRVFRRSFGADLFYFFLNGILPKLLLIIPLTVLSAALHRLVPLAFYSSVDAMPLWLRLRLAAIGVTAGPTRSHFYGAFTRFTTAPRKLTGWSR